MPGRYEAHLPGTLPEWLKPCEAHVIELSHPITLVREKSLWQLVEERIDEEIPADAHIRALMFLPAISPDTRVLVYYLPAGSGNVGK